MTARTYKFRYEGKDCYIKFNAEKKPLALVKAQRFLSKHWNMPILAPTYNAEGVAEEKQRIELFQQKGVYVPQVLASQAHYLVLSDIGRCVNMTLQTMTSDDERRALVEKALAALMDLHARGLCHSRPLVRDITYDAAQDRIGFIDLEENAAAVMPFESAVARDYFLFLCSAGRYLARRDLEIVARRIDWDPVRMDIAGLRRLVRFLYPFARIQQTLIKKKRRNEIAAALKAAVIIRRLLLERTDS